MKKLSGKIWRDVALIGAVEAVVFGSVWLLLNTYYSNRYPDVIRTWVPVLLFIVAFCFLVDHRLKNSPSE